MHFFFVLLLTFFETKVNVVFLSSNILSLLLKNYKYHA
jgi:hypothetical protein